MGIFDASYLTSPWRRLAGLHVVCRGTKPLSPSRDECRPVFTKILVGPDFTAFNCSVLQIDELADWLARQETEEEDA